MKFIHIADVNLGAQPDRGRIWSDVRAKEIYSTFHRVIEVCEEQKIELLLIVLHKADGTGFEGTGFPASEDSKYKDGNYCWRSGLY